MRCPHAWPSAWRAGPRAACGSRSAGAPDAQEPAYPFTCGKAQAHTGKGRLPKSPTKCPLPRTTEATKEGVCNIKSQERRASQHRHSHPDLGTAPLRTTSYTTAPLPGTSDGCTWVNVVLNYPCHLSPGSQDSTPPSLQNAKITFPQRSLNSKPIRYLKMLYDTSLVTILAMHTSVLFLCV